MYLSGLKKFKKIFLKKYKKHSYIKMEQANKIQSIKDLFKNTCDTLSQPMILN